MPSQRAIDFGCGRNRVLKPKLGKQNETYMRTDAADDTRWPRLFGDEGCSRTVEFQESEARSARSSPAAPSYRSADPSFRPQAPRAGTLTGSECLPWWICRLVGWPLPQTRSELWLRRGLVMQDAFRKSSSAGRNYRELQRKVSRVPTKSRMGCT